MEDYKKAFKKYLKEERDLDNSQDLKKILIDLDDVALSIINRLQDLEDMIRHYESEKDNANPFILLNDIPDDKYENLRFISDKLDGFSVGFESLKNYGMSEQPVNEDTYYPPQKLPIDEESEIEKIVSNFVSEYMGDDAASYYIRAGGKDIEIMAKSRNKEKNNFPSRSISQKNKDFMKEEWRETGESLIKLLEDEGFEGYEIILLGINSVRIKNQE